ncbi:MAG: hypothetical protein V3R62_09720 [Acidiferrobacterales bacterium]|jgi:Mor family transcriptional regulator
MSALQVSLSGYQAKALVAVTDFVIAGAKGEIDGRQLRAARNARDAIIESAIRGGDKIDRRTVRVKRDRQVVYGYSRGGMSIRRLAEKYSLSKAGVVAVLHRQGVKMRPVGRPRASA